MSSYKDKDLKVKLVSFAILVIIFFCVALYMGLINEPKRVKKELLINKEYFDNFNESFKGVIVDINTPKRKLKGGVKQSLLKVKLDYSTIMHYDPRDSLENYYCIIDFPLAEVIKEYAGGYTCIGDSFVFDGIIDTFYIKLNLWAKLKPDIVDNNIYLLEPFYTIPKYTKEQLVERIKTYPLPLNLPNDYYMMLFGKFKEKEKLIEFYKKLSGKEKYKEKKFHRNS